MKTQKVIKKGFTLIELMIVMGIIAILATIGVPNYLSLRNKKRLDVAAQLLVSELNSTMGRSRSQEDSKQWWIHLENPAGNGNDLYLVCSGTYGSFGSDCVAEGGIQQSKTQLGTGLEFTGFTDVIPGGMAKDAVFSKATGLLTPSAIVTIRIDSTAGAGFKIITINPNGSIEY